LDDVLPTPHPITSAYYVDLLGVLVIVLMFALRGVRPSLTIKSLDADLNDR
jgi:hypothetical protein